MSTQAQTPTTSAPRRGGAATTKAPGFAQSVWLVAEREIGSKLRSKAFLISSIILFLGALALVVWGGFQAQNESGTPVAVTSNASQYVQGVEGLEVTDASDRTQAEDLVTSGEVDAAIVGDSSSPTGFAVIAESSAPTQLLMSLAQVPPVELLDPDTTNAGLRYLVAIGFGVVFLLAASLFGGTIAQSVVEEKQTRVVELLISAIPTRALLAGKVIGNTVLAMAQILVLAAIAVVGLTVTGQSEVLQGLGAPIAWFAVFFLFGFILLALQGVSEIIKKVAIMTGNMEDPTPYVPTHAPLDDATTEVRP